MHDQGQSQGQDGDAGRIVGKPTLLVTFAQRLEPQPLLEAVEGAGYPAKSVRVYYRPAGTDQVIDALSGVVPAGESLTPGALGKSEVLSLETLLLLHPDARQFVAVRGALQSFGEADYKYSESTVAVGHEIGAPDIEGGAGTGAAAPTEEMREEK